MLPLHEVHHSLNCMSNLWSCVLNHPSPSRGYSQSNDRTIRFFFYLLSKWWTQGQNTNLQWFLCNAWRHCSDYFLEWSFKWRKNYRNFLLIFAARAYKLGTINDQCSKFISNKIIKLSIKFVCTNHVSMILPYAKIVGITTIIANSYRFSAIRIARFIHTKITLNRIKIPW